MRFLFVRQGTCRTSYHFFPSSAAQQFQHQIATQRDHLMGYLTAVATACTDTVTDQTMAEQEGSFHCWVEFCDSINLGGDIFLDGLSMEE